MLYVYSGGALQAIPACLFIAPPPHIGFLEPFATDVANIIVCAVTGEYHRSKRIMFLYRMFVSSVV